MNVEQILLELQEVLKDKDFTNETKNKIKEVFRMYCTFSSKESICFQIIEGLKKVDMFIVDTRENLVKMPRVKMNLDEHTLGITTCKNDLVAVVKSEQDTVVLFHELAHLTQTKDSYWISSEYPFHQLFQNAMLEGEATYYETLFAQHMCKDKLMLHGLLYGPISNQTSILYHVLLEFYKDMEFLLGTQLLTKWKQDSGNDMMLIASQHVAEVHHLDFKEIYQCWSLLLYHYYSRFGDEYRQDCAIRQYADQKDSHHFLVNDEEEYTLYMKELIEEMGKCQTRIQEIEKILSTPDNLKEAFQKRIAEEKQEMERYQKKYGNDQTLQEWNEELKQATSEDFKEPLKIELNALKELILNDSKQFQKQMSRLEQCQWYLSFHPTEQLKSLDITQLSAYKEASIQNRKVNRTPASYYYGSILEKATHK